MESSQQRLNKFIALQLGVSRREADNYIAQGRIRINGEVAVLGARLQPTDTVFFNNEPISATTAHQYFLLHKPVGYVCSRRAQGDIPTIYDRLPEQMRAFKPVGRLDKDSSGILILTNDGDFTYQMTHPKFHKQKDYEVSLDAELQPLHQQMINDYGVQLEDGPSKLILERMSDDNRLQWHVMMSEGRNRQIRRTFESLGYTVVKLHRTKFGPYSLNDLTPGDYKEFSL